MLEMLEMVALIFSLRAVMAREMRRVVVLNWQHLGLHQVVHMYEVPHLTGNWVLGQTMARGFRNLLSLMELGNP